MSLRTCQRLLASSVWRKSRSLVVYVAIRSEVETSRLIEAALAEGKRLFVPRVTGKGAMTALPVADAAALSPGFMGIPEPPPIGRPLTHADLVVVPGVAFSWGGLRLGYGGGYYDRFFEAFPESFRVGLLFGGQLVRDIPEETHDVRMNALIIDGIWLRVRGGQETLPPEDERT